MALVDDPDNSAQATGSEGQERTDHGLVAYILYALAAVLSLVELTFSGVAVIGVVLAHLKRYEVYNTWKESHYEWLIRTFWIALIAVVILSITFIGKERTCGCPM